MTEEKKHIIELDADPRGGGEIVVHLPGGTFEWDPNQVTLYQVMVPERVSTREGKALLERVAMHVPFNANLLYYLVDHPDLIPEEWKGHDIMSWGTIRSVLGIGPQFEVLRWEGGIWCLSSRLQYDTLPAGYVVVRVGYFSKNRPRLSR